MGKYSVLERKPNDFYPTPYVAAAPLFKHLDHSTYGCGKITFVEPCAGDGRLIQHLESDGHKCVYACDKEPQAVGIEKRDVLFFGGDFVQCDFIITNPPWERSVLHAMIDLFRMQAPTWLLFDADWKHTKQSKPYLPYCSKIVNVGRISWEGNGVSGKENCCWYLFGKNKTETLYFND